MAAAVDLFKWLADMWWQTAAAVGPETSDAGGVAKNKVTVITAVAKKTEMSVEAKRGELMESNIDAMEVHDNVL